MHPIPRIFMKIQTFRRMTQLCICATLLLAACKKPASPGPASRPAPEAASASAVATQAHAPVVAAASAGPVAETPFDFDAVPQAKGDIPPFPYVDYPPNVPEGYRATTVSPLDEVDVILGNQLHHLTGKVAMRTFSHKHADMSELEVRRNYQNALQAFGAVKVNVDQPGMHYLAEPRMAKLRAPFYDMSYDVYLARKGAARHWIVVMTSDSDTRLLSIEEQPFSQTLGYEGAAGKTQEVTATGAPPVARQPLDLATVPVNTAPLPPFPYLAYPAKVPEGYRMTHHASFDALGFIVGNQVRMVEGKVETRGFDYRLAGMSRLAVVRNYEAALKGLGAVRVDTVSPENAALAAANGDAAKLRAKLHIDGTGVPYAAYLVRAPDRNIWVALMAGDDHANLIVVDEKTMQQSVALVTANAMRTALAAEGHIALYINFDTDQATIRSDGQPTVDEIATLLKKDALLKLAIEGHTDNSGDEKHNLALSRQRADAVVRALVGRGIDSDRLRASGRGAAQPLVDNKDDAARAKNRRVELVKI